MPTLREVLNNNIDKYIKLGGKAGFFFAGYIHSDYEELMKEVLNKEANKYSKLITRFEGIKAAIKENREDPNSKVNTVTEYNTPKRIETNKQKERYQVDYANHRIYLYTRYIDVILNLMDSEIIESYKSFIDGSLIIITNCMIVGNIDNRDVMYKKSDTAKIAKKYNI